MTAPPFYRVARDVAWVGAEEGGQDTDDAWVARLPDGPPLALNGSAHAIWEAVVRGGSADQIAEAVGARVGGELPVTADEVLPFLADLVLRGLAEIADTGT